MSLSYQTYLISLNTQNTNEKDWKQYFDTEMNMLTNYKNHQDIETGNKKGPTINQENSYYINLYHIIITSILIYVIWQS
jgi:hypothetical protein